MVTLRTSLGTQESARRERFEPVGTTSSTNVQQAIEELATDIAALPVGVSNMREPTDAATVAILAADTAVGLITTTTAVTATLPLAADWIAAHHGDAELLIKDISGSAFTHNITASPTAPDTIVDGSGVVNAGYGTLTLGPRTGGWYVR